MRIPYRDQSDRFYDINLHSKHPFEQFAKWFKEAVEHPELYEANAMVLSTVSEDGRPSSRYVLLKGLDGRGFHFYTNASSQKGKDIEKNPNVSLLFYWEPLKRQVRVDGKASFLPDSEAQSYFSSRPKSSQIAAFVSNQSSPIPSSKHLVEKFDEALQAFSSTETVPKPKDWVGYAVAPESIEFWQGQTSRLHDRIHFFLPDSSKEISEFAKQGEAGWYFERLAP